MLVKFLIGYVLKISEYVRSPIVKSLCLEENNVMLDTTQCFVNAISNIGCSLRFALVLALLI